jgi:hypothetical protein
MYQDYGTWYIIYVESIVCYNNVIVILQQENNAIRNQKNSSNSLIHSINRFIAPLFAGFEIANHFDCYLDLAIRSFYFLIGSKRSLKRVLFAISIEETKTKTKTTSWVVLCDRAIIQPVVKRKQTLLLRIRRAIKSVFRFCRCVVGRRESKPCFEHARKIFSRSNFANNDNDSTNQLGSYR